MLKKRTIIVIFCVFALYLAAVFIYNRLQSRTLTNSVDASVDLSSCKLEELSNGELALTIPSTYVYGAKQSDLDAVAKANGYAGIQLNADGSATYTLTPQQHTAMLRDLAGGIHEKLDAMIGSDAYDNISTIETNEDFTTFRVTLDSTNVDFENSMSLMTLKMYSTMYNAFRGITDEEIAVSYYNKNGDLIASYASSPSEE